MARITDDSKCLTGTVGNVVFYEMNGIMYARTKPGKYRDAKTDKQLAMRARFSGCTAFYKQTKDTMLRHVWKMVAKDTGKNARSMFMQHNIHAFGKDKTVAYYSRLQFSAGALPLPEGLLIERYNDRDCLIQWEYDRQEDIDTPTDRLYVVELHSHEWPKVHKLEISRSERKAIFSTFEDISKNTYLYCFWGNKSETAFSPTHYFKEIPLAEP
ncbi:MAG: DUF6266 family protein [Tannerella sp.]|jgi:hypothetical protein|nr:DUF6266 family protein [Tannerella sp.]